MIKNVHNKQYCLEIEIEDLTKFDKYLAQDLLNHPTDCLYVFEEVSTDFVLATTSIPQQIQILLTSKANALSIRELQSSMVSKIVKLTGIVISVSPIKTKATKITVECSGCKHVINVLVRPGLGTFNLPKSCSSRTCPDNPFIEVKNKSKCINFQTIKLQETYEPGGVYASAPRQVELFCERFLCKKLIPGNHVIIHGIYCAEIIKKKVIPYVRVVGISIDRALGFVRNSDLETEEEISKYKRLSALPNIYEKITKSIAPSVYGHEDIKKAIVCLLFGGSKKQAGDGSLRRSDINVLLVGDPGTAKSQLLKFVEQVSPIGVYTSGRGSSAVGLTASIIQDPITRNFVVAAGAMVLADGGVICIDEFDKMKEGDRVAIHESMEQVLIYF